MKQVFISRANNLYCDYKLFVVHSTHNVLSIDVEDDVNFYETCNILKTYNSLIYKKINNIHYFVFNNSARFWTVSNSVVARISIKMNNEPIFVRTFIVSPHRLDGPAVYVDDFKLYVINKKIFDEKNFKKEVAKYKLSKMKC